MDESKYEEVDAPEEAREEDEVAPTTVANVAKLEVQTASVLPHPLDDRPLSPVSTASSISETPLAEQVKINGGSTGYNSNPSTPAKSIREIGERSENGIESPSETVSVPRSSGGATVCPFLICLLLWGFWTDECGCFWAAFHCTRVAETSDGDLAC